MAEWIETGRAVVFPWHCDHLGHMNVRWYAHFFDDAGFHLWNVAGVAQAEMRDLGINVVVARTATDYLHELKAGDFVAIQSGFTHVGTKSIRHAQRMMNAETGTLCAKQETVEVFFNLETRQATAMPETIRAKLERIVVSENDD